MTGLISTSGHQFNDWSADYRLLSSERFEEEIIFQILQKELAKQLSPGDPFVAAMDDSILRKRGNKTPGVAWHRDPTGPPFHLNLIRGQRILQISAAVPSGTGAVRMIPIDFVQAPKPKKPRPKASIQLWEEYEEMKHKLNIAKVGAERICKLRNHLDQHEETKNRDLWMVVDGRFTNRRLIQNLPERTVLIGRIRGDAKLYHPPTNTDQPQAAGRKKSYGQRAPTPEELRKDDNVPWQTVPIFATGKLHNFKVKTMGPLLWRTAGADQPLLLIVIAPLAYKLRKNSRPLYRRPAYLICTNPDMPIEKIIQPYIWRWDIEVNIRDEKQLIGVGEAQVHSKSSVEKAPALAVAAYSILLLAAHKTYPNSTFNGVVPPPKWRQETKKNRPSTQDLINHVRFELWGQAMGKTNFSGFMSQPAHDIKPEKSLPNLASATLYAVA